MSSSVEDVEKNEAAAEDMLKMQEKQLDAENQEEQPNAEESQIGTQEDMPKAEEELTKAEKKMTKAEKKQAKEEKKQAAREIMKVWKEEKKEKRALRKTRLKARPLWMKILTKVGIVAAVLAALAGAFFLVGGKNIVEAQIVKYYFSNIYAIEEMDTEDIRKDCVIDTEAAEKINAMPSYDEDDTWAIYIYMVGSNLESQDENDLSEMVDEMSIRSAEENKAASAEKSAEYIDQYLQALEEANMEMPSPMYVANAPEASESIPVTEDIIKAEGDGAAYMDIEEILKADLSDNVDIVIQTGGARHWTVPTINPNRIQRFHVEDHMLVEEESLPTQSMGSADALADFLSYCQENHDADHKMVIFWNHGGGSTGYGLDEIFCEMMSLKDMKEALVKVYGDSPKQAPFEVIGFDACLMASAEVLDCFEDYGKYLVASEETEPGFGWYYTGWLNKLSANPAMNGAVVGMNIVDDYMDFYKALDMKMAKLAGENSVGLFVLDLKEAAKAYDVYGDLVKQVLVDTQTDPEALTSLCRAAHESIHYASEVSDLYNTVDLGIMMENIAERYPQQTGEIKDIIAKSVLYGRNENNMVGSSGISVYFPDSVTKKTSLVLMMKYIDNITDNEAIKNLYFYKAAGCSSKEMKTSLKNLGITKLKNIDTEALKEVTSEEPVIGDGGVYTLEVSKKALKYIEDYKFALGFRSDEGILDYGEASEPVFMDENGKLTAAFDGKWPGLGGQPLACEVIQSHNGIVTYRSTILLNGKDAYLMYSYDEIKGEFTIIGAYLKEDQIEGDYIGRNVSDLKLGDKITPVYECSTSGGTFIQKGKAVRYKGNTKISYEALPDGGYCSAINFNDVRGDVFNSKVVAFEEKNGKVSDMEVTNEIAIVED